jgi:hypothetical protein
MELDPEIWGPYYWFVLFTIALTYPIYPNDISKKKYYDFIQNLPLFIPVEKFGNSFNELLDKYPVTPYLDSRESFIRWVHFIHNQINVKNGKNIVSLEDAMTNYYSNYKPKKEIEFEFIKKKRKFIYLFILLVLCIASWYLYKF